MKQVIEDILNNMILPEHKDILCGYKILMPNERFDFLGKTSFESPRITLYFKDSVNTTFRLRDTIEEMMDEVWTTIYNYTNVATDLYYRKVAICDDDEVIEESENKKSNYVNVIKQLVEPFKDEDCVCDIDVSYDEEDDMYGVYVVLGHEELNDNFFSSSAMGFYAKKLRVDINKTIVDYLPIKNLYVGSYGAPNCDWKPYGH